MTILWPLLRTIKAYPKVNEIIAIAKMGPVNGGKISELLMSENDSIAAIVKATPLKAYAIYLNTLVSNILANAERRTTLSRVSTGIIPIAKNPASTNATCTPNVADATADNVRTEI